MRSAAILGVLATIACSADRFAIDLSTTHQVWEGSGTSIAAWEDAQRELVRTDAWRRLWVEDMGNTVLRIDLLPTPLDPVGINSSRVVRFGDDLAANVALFDYRRSPRASIYGQLAAELDRDLHGELKVLATVWTPPHWLKDGATLANGGNDSGGGTLRMDADNLQQYARYIAAAVVAWQRRFGVEIHALSIQNEPRFALEYNSMAITPADYAKALAAVATELDANGLTTRLFGPEDVGYGKEDDHSMLDEQLAFVYATMADPIAGRALDAIAVHGYGGDGIESNGYAAPDNWTYYRTQIERYGLPSWQTESGGGSPVWNGDGTFGAEGTGGPMMFANVIYEGMTYGDISLWCNWLFTAPTLDTHALLGEDLDADNPKYAAAKHFFRFIRPGAVRVGVTPADRDGARIVAWHHADVDQLTIVVLNLREVPAKIELDGAGARTLQRYQTTKDANLAQREPVSFANGRLAIELPAESITTLSEVL